MGKFFSGVSLPRGNSTGRQAYEVASCDLSFGTKAYYTYYT